MEVAEKTKSKTEYESHMARLDSDYNKIKKALVQNNDFLRKSSKQFEQKLIEPRQLVDECIAQHKARYKIKVDALKAKLEKDVAALNEAFEEDMKQENPKLVASIESGKKKQTALELKRGSLNWEMFILPELGRGISKIKLYSNQYSRCFQKGIVQELFKPMAIALLEHSEEEQVFDSHGGEEPYFTGGYSTHYSYKLEIPEKLLTFKSFKEQQQFAKKIAEILAQDS